MRMSFLEYHVKVLLSKTPYTPSEYFGILNFFFPDSKISPSTRNAFKSNSPACPRASDGIRFHSKETRPTRCAAILVYCSVRDWTRFCYAIGFANIQIRSSHVIGFVAVYFFHSRERTKKYPDSLPNSPDACGWKPNSERKSCEFKNNRILVDGT